MCTNYRPTARDLIESRFGLSGPLDEFKPETFPGYSAPVVRRRVDPGMSGNECIAATFGLVPRWSRTGKDFRHCYNARIETIASKPSFRAAWRARQFCVVPMDCFYEPCYESGRPVRWRIQLASMQPFAAGGIWECWKSPTGEWVQSFSLITVNADQHAVMRRFQPPDDEKRMLVLLAPNDYEAWLTGTVNDALMLSRTFPAEQLLAEPAPLPRRTAGEGGNPGPQLAMFG